MKKLMVAVCVTAVLSALVMSGCKGQTTSEKEKETAVSDTPTQQPSSENEDEGYVGTVTLDDGDHPLLVYGGAGYAIYESEGVAKVLNTIASDETLERYEILGSVSYEGKDYPVTEICVEAFYGYETVKEIVLPDSIVKIGANAFDVCAELTKINVPDSVKEIGNEAFSACTSLKEIELPEGITTWGTGLFFDCTALEDVELPDDMPYIPEEMFTNCSALKKLVLPDSVKSINFEAFWDCEALKDIELPEGLVSIDTRAFYNCMVLKEIKLPSSLSSCAEDIFEFCDELETVYVPEDKVDFYREHLSTPAAVEGY